MQNRIVEINSDGAYLSVKRGFLTVQLKDRPVGKVSIDDMGALIVRGHGASFSVNVCTRLADANVPVVICGSNQAPASVIWPISGHFAQGLHMQAQATANKPLLKRLWAQLIKAKILAQSNVLVAFERDAKDLQAMASRVKSGDSDNLEAQAARRYWSRLMGNEFRRDRSGDGINAALNYGYTVLRSATARSIIAAGLHPSLSINHQSRGDALRLADDIMEPFRPWVDHRVRSLVITEICGTKIELTPEIKSLLAAVLLTDLETPYGASPIQICIDRAAQSLVRVFNSDQRNIDLPGAAIPQMPTKSGVLQ